MTPTLQIIVRVDRPERELLPLVSHLYDLRNPGLEVLVVYTEPPIDLAAVQAEYPIACLPVPAGTPPGMALNMATERSQSTYVVTVSSSRLPRDRQWLFHLLKHFSDTGVAAVSGEGWDLSMLSLRAPSYRQDLAAFLAAPQFGPCLENMAFRRDLWNLHAFDERLSICIDRQWAYRLLCEGYQVVLDYDSRMHDLDPLSPEQQFRRYWAMNLSFPQFIQPEKANKSLWALAVERAWHSRNPIELLRAYFTWEKIRKISFWQATPAQAIAARAAFSRPGDKWAV